MRTAYRSVLHHLRSWIPGSAARPRDDAEGGRSGVRSANDALPSAPAEPSESTPDSSVVPPLQELLPESVTVELPRTTTSRSFSLLPFLLDLTNLGLKLTTIPAK